MGGYIDGYPQPHYKKKEKGKSTFFQRLWLLGELTSNLFLMVARCTRGLIGHLHWSRGLREGEPFSGKRGPDLFFSQLDQHERPVEISSRGIKLHQLRLTIRDIMIILSGIIVRLLELEDCLFIGLSIDLLQGSLMAYLDLLQPPLRHLGELGHLAHFIFSIILGLLGFLPSPIGSVPLLFGLFPSGLGIPLRNIFVTRCQGRGLSELSNRLLDLNNLIVLGLELGQSHGRR